MARGYIVTIDPSAAIPSRSELSLVSAGIEVVGGEGKGIDWGEAAIKAFLAEQRYGEVPTDYRVPNRQITIPLTLYATTAISEETARTRLREKVGLLQREGGVLKRERSAAPGEKLYADIVNASLTIPDIWGEGGVEPNLVLRLECLPDFYGESIALENIEAVGQTIAVLNDVATKAPAVIKGDYPARVTLQVTNQTANDQKALIWGFRSRHYSSEGNAKLYLDAYTASAVNGSKAIALAGTYSGSGMELPAGEQFLNQWQPFMTTDPEVGGHQHQVGTYRVWARMKAAKPGPKVRLSWGLDDATTYTINQFTSLIEGWQLVDLGEIRVEESSPGAETWWRGVLQVYVTASFTIQVDRLFFQPLDESAGRVRATGINTSNVLITAGAHQKKQKSGASGGTQVWTPIAYPGASSVILKAGSEKSKNLELTEYAFSLLEGSAVKGIEMILTFTCSTGSVTTVNIAPLNGTGTKAKEREANQGTYVFGGPTDLWGGSFTAKQVKEAAFGCSLELSIPGLGVESTLTANVEIKVYWAFAAEAAVLDSVLYAERQTQIRNDGTYREDTTAGGTVFVRVSEEIGDLPRLPPSGLENRSVEVFLKNSRGLIFQEQGRTQAEQEDPGLDKIRLKVNYQPCYIGRI